MKRGFALFLAVALVLSLPAASLARGLKFGASYMTLSSSYFTAMNSAIQAVVEDNGDTLVAMDPERDQAKQNSQIREMIAQGVEALFLAPVDSLGVKEGLLACREAGVPVINVDSAVDDEELVACVIASDNLEAGQLCGEDLLRRREGGKVAIIGNFGAETSRDRLARFEEIIGANPNFSIAAKKDCKGDKGLARVMMSAILQETPEIDVVMCVSDSVALAAVTVLREADRLKDILVYGVNGSPDAKRAIKNGEMAGTAAQSPISMGHIACEAANRILNGEKIEKHISVPVLFIDANNLDKFFLDGWQ